MIISTMKYPQCLSVQFFLPIYVIMVLLVCYFMTIFFMRYMHSYWKKKKVPQLHPVFFYGNQKKAWNGTCSKTELFLEIYTMFKSQHVKFGGFYMLWKPYFMPIDPTIIKDILKNSFHSFQDHGLYHHKKDMLFENVFTLEGQRWNELRKIMGPLFRPSNIRMLFELLVKKYETLDKGIYENCVQKKRPATINKVLDAWMNSTYGLETDNFEYPREGTQSFGSYIFDPRKYWFVLEQIIPWSLLGYFGNKASNGKELEKLFQTKFDTYMINRDQRKAAANSFMDLLIKETEILDESNNITNHHKKKSSSMLTREDIVSHSFLFLASGFETSATSMTFVLLDLAMNLDIQDNLRSEINEVLLRYENQLTFEALHEMNLLEKIVKESLRHHPPFARIARICTKDYIIPNTDIVIEKGTKTIIPMWGIHMDEEYFPEPERFNPDHFDKENVEKRPECTWFPFGEGKRACLGQKLAMMQTKATVALLIKDYAFEVNKRTKLPIEMTAFTIISKIKGDLWLNVHKV